MATNNPLLEKLRYHVTGAIERGEAEAIEAKEDKAVDRLETQLQECKWFLLCTNPATTTVKHPILGDVPCCERCAKFAR